MARYGTAQGKSRTRDPGGRGVPLHRLQALLDRVLVRAGERRVDQVARVRVPGVHRKLVAVLGGAPDLVDVGEIDHRVDALAEQVHAQGDQADVPGPLAVAEQAALDPVRAGQHRQLGVRDGGAAVVVGVHGHAHVLAVRQVPAHPLDLVGVHVRGGTLDGAGQVEDDLPAGPRLPDVHDRRADLGGVVELGVHEDLGRVLVAEVAAGQVLLGVLHHRLGALDGQGLGLLPVVAEHHPAEHRRGRVVHVHRGARARRPATARVRSISSSRAWVRTEICTSSGIRPLLDQAPDEVEVRLAGRREADLDLLVAHPDQQVEHGPLTGRAHGVDQGLVAVAEVGGQPPRGLGDAPAGPGPVRQVDRLERGIPLAGHAAGLLPDRGMPAGYPARSDWQVRAEAGLGIADVIGMHCEDLLPRGSGGGQPSRQNSAARAACYRPPPRQVSSSIPCIMAFRQ